jgi:hypothetical protein
MNQKRTQCNKTPHQKQRYKQQLVENGLLFIFH